MYISELSVGTRLRDSRSGHSFLIGGHGLPGYPGTVLVSEYVIARRALDAPKAEYTDPERKKFGSNDYPETDLHRWLNSDAEDGFLAELSPEMQLALETTAVPYSRTPESVETFEAKVFIPSLEELGAVCPDHTPEGGRIPVFKEFRRRFALPAAEVVAEARPGWGVLSEGDSWCYWLRSSHPLHSSVQYVCHSHSPYVFYGAFREYIGVRPICCVNDALEVEQLDGAYTVCARERSV